MTYKEMERAALLRLPVIVRIRVSASYEKFKMFIVELANRYKDGVAYPTVTCEDGISNSVVRLEAEDVLGFAEEQEETPKAKPADKTGQIVWINLGRMSDGTDAFRIQAERDGVVIGDYVGYMDEKHDIMRCYIDKGRINQDLPRKVELSFHEIRRGGSW